MKGAADSRAISGADSVTKCLPQVDNSMVGSAVWQVTRLDGTIYLLYQYMILQRKFNILRTVFNELLEITRCEVRAGRPLNFMTQ